MYVCIAWYKHVLEGLREFETVLQSQDKVEFLYRAMQTQEKTFLIITFRTKCYNI